MGASLWRRSDEETDDGVTHGRQAWLRRRSGDSFFPPRAGEAAMLEEGVGDHCHERMTMKTGPGSPLEVVETEFFLQLLMGLLADPPRLDRGR
jgi:hypothetical protein